MTRGTAQAVAISIAGLLLLAGLVVMVLGIGWLSALLCSVAVLWALALLVRPPRRA